jgi:glutathione S-transferase
VTAVSVLYSNTSCPHSLRARLALLYARIHCELRDVALDDLPADVNAVPLLQLPGGKLLDDSLSIMRWACARHPELGLWPDIRVRQQAIENLVRIIDGPFAEACGHYQTAQRVVRPGSRDFRAEAEIFLAQLEARLARMEYLVGDSETLADLAALPFVHQFAEVDRTWFDISPYRCLRSWLAGYRDNPAWQQALLPAPRWRPGAEPTYLGVGGHRVSA